jgi:hypothetical protein
MFKGLFQKVKWAVQSLTTPNVPLLPPPVMFIPKPKSKTEEIMEIIHKSQIYGPAIKLLNKMTHTVELTFNTDVECELISGWCSQRFRTVSLMQYGRTLTIL